MRLKASHIILITIASFALLMNAACKKQKTLTAGGIIKFSQDTLKFDTVFTAAGSFTSYILIYNPQDEAIQLSSVRLQNGSSSYFHLNVDGFPGNNIPNLKIAAHDSIYVFATVNINPNDTLTPFIVTDELIATLNGKDFTLPFTAYGQNAHYIISDSIHVDTTWLTDKPYVVIHNCVVGPGASLSIPADCKVYMHQDGRFIVYGGFFVDTVTKKDSVVFQGDRLDRAYFNYMEYPGEWCGIWFVPGSRGNISHAVIKNCGGNAAYYNYFTQGSAIEVDTAAQLNIDHSIIKNSYSIGILGYAGNITASNCLVQTTAGEALAITQGGTDSIINCTFANYGSVLVAHQDAPTVAILNYYSPDGITYSYGALNAVLRNCIVYGALDSEIICDASSNAPARLFMDHCLLKMGSVRESFVQFNGTLFNQDPMFTDPITAKDYHLQTGSPAIDAGVTVSLSDDLDGKPRPVGSGIDIGCYESQ